jgi:hypothetical protein
MATSSRPLPEPEVDPQRAVEAVQRAWRQAKQDVLTSWPGPNWGADYFAAEVAWRLSFCQSAGVDVEPLRAEWLARYGAYQGAGGKMKYRPI